MFSREIESLLTLVALAASPDGFEVPSDMTVFKDATNRLDCSEESTTHLTDHNISAWVSFNRSILKDKMKLGPIGRRLWLDMVIDDLSEFPDKRFVLKLIKSVKLPEDRRKSKTRRKEGFAADFALSAVA